MPLGCSTSVRARGVVVAVIAASCFPASGASVDEYTETATRHLVQAVESQRDGSHLARLSSLRLLRDPMMKELFYKLLQHDEWLVQVHALLGLAEIDENQQLDPWLVTQIDPQAREQVIANALDMELLNSDGMNKILEWDHLESGNRLLLLAELQSRGQDINREDLEELADDNDLIVAGVASLLLARDGELAPLSAVTSRLRSASTSERMSVLQRLIEVIRIYEIKSAAPWLDEILETQVNDDSLQYWGIYSLMTIDSERGRQRWNEMVGTTPSYRERIMASLQFLEAALPPDEAARALLRADEDELISQILDTAQAVSQNEEIQEHVTALIDTGHTRVIDWALRRSRDFPADDAVVIYGHFIDQQENSRRAEDVAQRSQAISAMATLLELAPDNALARLEAAEDDSMMQQTLLMGSLQSTDSRLLDTISSFRRIGSSRPDSLVLLLMARDGNRLSPTDLQQLGRISSGGGQITDTLQTQAAWLYLKHTDGLQAALVRLAPPN